MSNPTVKIYFSGPVRRPSPEREIIIETSGVKLVRDLLLRLGYTNSEMEMLTVLKDGVKVTPEDNLGDAKEIVVTLLVGGG